MQLIGTALKVGSGGRSCNTNLGFSPNGVLARKGVKVYMHGYRNLGIFYENAVNKILADVVKACKPVSATVIGEFTARGGLSSTIEASYP